MSIDLRRIEFSFESNEVDPKYQKADKKIEHDIKCFCDGKELGLIQFTEYINALGSNIDSHLPNEKITILYFDWIEVKDEYKQLGIGQLLYKEFGKIYSEQFNGIPVARNFDNPIAEYSLKKAISLGWVPEQAFSEEFTARNESAYYKNPEIIEELKNKLPDGYTLG